MYRDDYPSLFTHYSKTNPTLNFEAIMAAMQEHFGDVFQLGVLETIFKKKEEASARAARTPKGSYETFFDACMDGLKSCGTKEEVVRALYPLLQNNDSPIYNMLVGNFIFTGKSTRQLGYLEKMATGQLSMAEPLTVVDMIRLVYGFNRRHDGQHRPPLPKIAVAHISALLNNRYLEDSAVLLVNFNSDLTAPPKWGVVDKQKVPYWVHCDIALTPTEKATLKAALHRDEDITYSGATANHLPSTGYSALAWLQTRIPKVWTFDINADFLSLLRSTLFVYFGGDDEDSLKHNVSPSEELAFYTPQFHYLAENFTKNNLATPFQGGNALLRLSWAALDGTLINKSVSFQPGDISAVLKQITDMTYRNIVAIQNVNVKTLVPGLVETMSTYVATPLLPSRDEGVESLMPDEVPRQPLLVSTTESNGRTKVSLSIPHPLIISDLYRHHKLKCNEIGLNPEFFPSEEHDQSVIAAILLNAVIRGQAKKQCIDITLSDLVTLSDSRQRFLIQQLQENVYVCEFITHGHRDLEIVKKAIEPILARNRWLKHCGYKPPLTDNYWQQATTFWLSYLAEHADVWQSLPQHEAFKDHIKAMGVEGLNKLLRLQDIAFNDLPLLKEKKEKNKEQLPFYAGYNEREAVAYLRVLATHLSSDKAFPYDTLVVDYYQSSGDALLELCAIINQRNQRDSRTTGIDKLCFSNITNKDDFMSFLTRLNDQLNGLTSLIFIQGAAVDDDITATCKTINDKILRNRMTRSEQHIRELIGSAGGWQAINPVIEEDAVLEPEFPTAGAGAAAGGGRASSGRRSEQKLQNVREQLAERIRNYTADNHAWTHSDSASQLQLQQQMQMEQQQQVLPKKRQVVNAGPRPEIVTGELVRYDNINALDDLVAPSGINKQELFSQWISANPVVQAPGIIHAMTKQAAQVLLKKYRFLSSGLHVNNLPSGFYTQRNPDGELVLCYDVNMGYLKEPTPLTLDLDTELPMVETWAGDYNLVGPAALTIEQQKALFQALQPDGVVNDDTKTQLLSLLDPEVSDWYQNNVLLDNNPQQLKSLAQVYYRYGKNGLAVLKDKLSQVKSALQDNFWRVFKISVLGTCGNFNALMSVSAFDTMYQMSATLSENPKALRLWQAVLQSHGEGVGFHSIETLWSAFNYFLTELKDMRLPILGNEFDGIGPQNTLVFMDRVLSCLYMLREPESERLFLSPPHLMRWDMKEGGVPYAIKEGFQRFDDELHLRDFSEGAPTYTPNLAELYRWPQDDTIERRMLRALAASTARFNDQDYNVLKTALCNGEDISKHMLMWILHAQRESSTPARTLLDNLGAVSDLNIFKTIASNIQQALYVKKRASLLIHWPAMMALCQLPSDRVNNLSRLIDQFPDGSFLEALDLIWHKNSGTFTDAEWTRLDRLALIAQQLRCDDPIVADAFKLAALYHFDDRNLRTFLALITTAIDTPVLKQTLSGLFKHLLAVDFQSMRREKLSSLFNPNIFTYICSAIEKMKRDPLRSDTEREPLVEKLTRMEISFKISSSGRFQALTEDKRNEVTGAFSNNYQERLWQFFQTHLVYPTTKEAGDAFSHLCGFFVGLENARTYFHDIEYLLLHLERLYPNTGGSVAYWNVEYFSELLTLLQPRDGERKAFPFGILTTLLELDEFKPTSMEHITEKLKDESKLKLNLVLQSGFTRKEQALFLKAIFKYRLDESTIRSTINTLREPSYTKVRESLLTSLLTSPDGRTFGARWTESCILHNLTSEYPEIAALWFKEIEPREGRAYALFQTIIQNRTQAKELFRIMALSTLDAGPRDKETYERELSQKSEKLLQRLIGLNITELQQIDALYSTKPYPTTNRLLRLLKTYHERKATVSGSSADCLQEVLKEYEINPYPETRRDYTQHAVTREKDLYRMLRDTEVTHKDGQRSYLDTASLDTLAHVFNYLKQYEDGDLLLAGKRIRYMTKMELALQFKALSDQMDRQSTAALWAVLFEVLGRTTGKYPHLAQQFALIANDIGIHGDKRVLELATGEGKSHFVALRAAKNVGKAHKVDICTAKQTLAERDLLDYKGFFDYLGIKSACVDSQSGFDVYNSSDVVYTTLGGLSLLRDRALHEGSTLRNSDVGLLDEADFIRFDEGTKTEYNYAISTGIMPKQMTWFYQAINAAYHEVKTSGATFITTDVANNFFEKLLAYAGDDESKKQVIYEAIDEENPCIELLRSAHEAHQLTRLKDFSVLDKEIEFVGERYTAQEIVPLSTDNQKMQGSTFSRLVQQLLAVRLNTEASKEHPPKPQTFHVPPESCVLSSRVASQLMETTTGLWSKGWEGFTGTLSGNQAQILQSEVLRVPTNQRDQREWSGARFYDNAERRNEAIKVELQRCLGHDQSVLFACKNDLQVQELESALKASLPRHQGRFIYYTNEDPQKRTPAQVLAEKSRKSESTVLVASGFGRGDNVGVEAVFLMGTTDRNDRLQKGGRTARNGAKGKVLEFYCEEEVKKERTELLRYLGEERTSPDPTLLLDEVMSLREQVDYKKSQLKQVYDHGRSQLSDWGMRYLSTLNVSVRDKASRSFAKILKNLDTKYIAIRASRGGFEAQTSLIKTTILASVAAFSEQQSLVSDFQYNEFHAPRIRWEMDQKLQEDAQIRTQRLSSCRQALALDIGEKQHHYPNISIVSDMETKITTRLGVVDNTFSLFSSEKDVGIWEQWCQKIPKDKHPAIFKAVRNVKKFLIGGSAGANYSDLFDTLLTSTTNRIDAGDNIETIMAFWERLDSYLSSQDATDVIEWLQWGLGIKGKNKIRLLAEVFQMPGPIAALYKDEIKSYWHGSRKNFDCFSNILYVLRTEHELMPAGHKVTQTGVTLILYAGRVGDIFRLFTPKVLKKRPDLLTQIRTQELCTKTFYEHVIRLNLSDSEYVTEKLEPLQKLYEYRNTAMSNKDVIAWFRAPRYRLQREMFLTVITTTDTTKRMGLEQWCCVSLLAQAGACYKDMFSRCGKSNLSPDILIPYLRSKQDLSRLETLLSVLDFEMSIGNDNQRPNLKDLEEWVRYAERVQPIFDMFAEKENQMLFFIENKELFHIIQKNEAYPLNFYKLLKEFGAYDRDTIEALYPIYDLFENKTNPEDIMKHERVASWFNFDSNDTRKNRIAFLRMIASAKLIGTRWDKLENDKLLVLAMDKYIARTTTIVAQSNNYKGTRDLSLEQKKEILSLSNELAAIYASPTPSDKTPSMVDLQKFITDYNGWKNVFQPKASSRKKQVKDLQILLGKTPNYADTLKALHEAKLSAITSDAEINKHRLFKLNRQGRSRWLDTLSKMEDTLICSWLKEASALPSFGCYDRSNKDLLVKMVDALSQAMVIPAKSGGFFGMSTAKNARWLNLKAAMEAVSTAKTAELGGKVDALHFLLEKELPLLPGHLRTLAKEIVARTKVGLNKMAP